VGGVLLEFKEETGRAKRTKQRAKSKERAGVQPAGYAPRGKRGKRGKRAQSDRIE